MRLSILSTKHLKYYILMLFLLFLVVIRNIIGINLPVSSFLIVAFFVGLLCDNEEIVAFICSMAPFEMTFQYRYMILIGAAFLILKNRKIKPWAILPLVGMIIWDYLHYLDEGIAFASFMRMGGIRFYGLMQSNLI